jgi:hypothetical protein
MHFQFTYFELQDYIQTLQYKSLDPSFLESFERLSEFLPKMLSVLHTEAMAIAMESSPSPLTADLKAAFIVKLREKSLREMLSLLQQETRYQHLFAALHHFLQLPSNSHLTELKVMVRGFHDAFQAKVSIEVLSNVLTRFIRTKLMNSKEAGLFEFQKDVPQLRRKYDLKKQLDADPILASLVENQSYPFTKQDLSKLSEDEYQIIRDHKIARIFLLANFRINDLDQGLLRTMASLNAQELLNPLDHSDSANVDEIVRLAECTKQNIGLDNLRQLLTFLYKSDDFKIGNLVWALRVANTITCRAPETLKLFFTRLSTTPPFDIAIIQSRDLYNRARIELNEDIPYSEVYSSYRNASAEPHLMPTDAALSDSIEHFEALDKHCVQIKLIGYSDDALKFLLKATVTNFSKASTREEKKELEAYIWAALREFLERKTGVTLRCNQLINAHLILNSHQKRTIAQIKAGDRRPAMQAIMMAFCALTTGKKQYCAEESVYLAEHHKDMFRSFYEALGLITTCNVSSAEHDDDPLNATSYLGNIVYGISDIFRMGYLALMERQIPYFHPADVTFHVAHVGPLLQKQVTQLGSSDSGVRSYETTKMYHDIWEYISRNNRAYPPTYNLDSFRAYLIEKKYFTPADVSSLLNQFNIKQWYNSAIAALTIQRNVDYQIQPSIYDGEPAVVLNGQANDIAEWPGGLHQIICARESLRIPKQRKVSSVAQSHQFFNLFSNFFVVTNDIGNKPCERYLNKLYSGATLLSLPECRQSKAIAILPIVSPDINAQYIQLIQDIKQARQVGRPLLLLFKSIKEATAFYTYAMDCGESITLSIEASTRAISALTGLGLPGSVVCTTFNACQFDIVPSPEAEANGGLGVLLCSLPEDERDMLAYFSRTGQQGRGGFYGFRLERGQFVQQSVSYFGPSEDCIARWIKKLREEEVSTYVIDDLHFSYADLIFDLQKLLYDFQNPKMILIYREYLGLMLERVNESYQMQSDFSLEFSKIVLEMIKSSGCDLSVLSDLAKKTNNLGMIRFFGQIQTSIMVATSAVGLTFFGPGSSPDLGGSIPPATPDRCGL